STAPLAEQPEHPAEHHETGSKRHAGWKKEGNPAPAFEGGGRHLADQPPAGARRREEPGERARRQHAGRVEEAPEDEAVPRVRREEPEAEELDPSPHVPAGAHEERE